MFYSGSEQHDTQNTHRISTFGTRKLLKFKVFGVFVVEAGCILRIILHLPSVSCSEPCFFQPGKNLYIHLSIMTDYMSSQILDIIVYLVVFSWF